jgi:hypothetical protein
MEEMEELHPSINRDERANFECPAHILKPQNLLAQFLCAQNGLNLRWTLGIRGRNLIYSTKACLRGKTPKDIPYHLKKGMVCRF